MTTADFKIREDEKDEEEKEKGKEGRNLLGRPSFEELENGRFRCVETGHEMPSKAIDSYANCKRCRLGLVDYALSHRKPPLNMFKPHPESRSKLICKLTGDSVNKSEEHIWKHINGKRFLNKLEQKEAGLLSPNKVKKGAQMPEEASKQVKEDMKKEKKKKRKKEKKKKKKKKKKMEDTRIDDSEPKEYSNKDIDSEELDFWTPPVGSRWDFDDGGDRWDSDSESGQETIEVSGAEGVDGEPGNDSKELCKSTRIKRPSEVGPSSLTSGKKMKSKSNSSS